MHIAQHTKTYLAQMDADNNKKMARKQLQTISTKTNWKIYFRE